MIPRSRTVTTTLAALMLLGATGGGALYTKNTVEQADRTAPTTVWKKPKKGPSENGPVAGLAQGRRDNALSRKLLPVPADYRLGPDIDGFGNDAYVSGEEAQKLAGSGDVTGMAMRSYTRYANDLIVKIELIRMKHPEDVADLSAFEAELADSFSVFREGPEIDGHREARCFLTSEGEAEATEVEEMFCTAYEGDVLVSLDATGAAPLEKSDAAALLKKQLERLAESRRGSA